MRTGLLGLSLLGLAATSRFRMEMLPMPTLWPLVPLSRGGEALEAQVAAKDAIEGEASALSPIDRADSLVVLCFLVAASTIQDACLLPHNCSNSSTRTIGSWEIRTRLLTSSGLGSRSPERSRDR